MDRAAALEAFCFEHPELYLIPVEALSPSGIDASFSAALVRRGVAEPAWISTFNAAFVAYWSRAADLYARAPDAWFPPRLQNVCIVMDAERARPYHQPLFNASWTLSHADFDPSVSNVEFAAFQFLHAERLTAYKDMPKAIVAGLSYWLVRSPSEREDFCRAARSSSRLDADVFVALADAMPWVPTLFHPTLRPPPEDQPPLRSVPQGSLLVPEGALSQLQAFVPAIRGAIEGVQERYQRRLGSAEGTAGDGERVLTWLRARKPRVLITDGDGETLWDPEQPESCDALHQAVRAVTAEVADSLIADLQVVGDRTDAFFDSLREPERLPLSSGEVEQIGGVYLHESRRLVVYSLVQPGLDPLREPAPAYHRLLLGARTIHEWGHLADAAGWLPVPAMLQATHSDAQRRIGRAVDRIVANAPPGFQQSVAKDVHTAGQSAGGFVCRLVLSRMSDYVSNMLARRYLRPSELEAYVRSNVSPHFDEALTPLELLARSAFEYQYLSLGLVAEPLRYFLQSTWFQTYLLDPGVMTPADLEELFEAVASLCSCYRVDESAFV